jgi:hypothetical protein
VKPINSRPQFPQKSPGNPEVQSAKPIESVEKETQADQPQNPQDWLKPKIFKGSGLV